MKITNKNNTLLNSIVVEDSRLAREGLVRMLKNFSEIKVIGEADHPSTALVLIKKHKPDLIFLDIHMPGSSGFDLLEQLDYIPRVIFTTAYSEYAVRSFDYHTIDYLMKPISQKRLATAIQKLTTPEGNRSEDNSSDESKPILEFNSKLFVKDGEQCHLVSLESIRYFESCKNYVIIYFNDTKAFVKKSLTNIEERLPNKHFFRISRQYVINLHEIKSIDLTIQEGYEIIMKDNKVLNVSRRNGEILRSLLSF
jgi:two-component system, LytTR family, response regulator